MKIPTLDQAARTNPYRLVPAPSEPPREHGYLMMISSSIYRPECIIYGPYRWQWLTRLRARLRLITNVHEAIVICSVHDFLYKMLPMQTERVQQSFHRYSYPNEHGVFGIITARFE